MSIYKDCDIRGIYGQELREEEVCDIGRAVGTLLQGRQILVGGDVRLSTPALKAALIQGLLECGAQVIDLGTLPTPAAYFAKSGNGLQSYGLAIVTASHNPAQYNGIKLMLGDSPIQPEDLLHIKQLVQSRNFIFRTGSCRRENVLPAYEQFLHSLLGPCSKKVVVDCGNGACSLNAPAVFRSFGYEVVELFCKPDGAFPNRSPNPAVYSNLSALCAAVAEQQADLGVAFDGDGDRVVFVDDTGKAVISEKSLALLIRWARKEENFSVVYDQKCSSLVRREIESLGGRPLMERSGHVFIKQTFLRNQSVLAGEISGHFFFRELGYDDGLYAALRMGELLERSGQRLSTLASQLPDPLITPDLRCPVPYERQNAVLDQVKTYFRQYPLNELDGVRVEFANGWLLIRKSVTEQAMTIRIEAQSTDSLEAIKAQLRRAAPELVF